jgi:hypothetical protein
MMQAVQPQVYTKDILNRYSLTACTKEPLECSPWQQVTIGLLLLIYIKRPLYLHFSSNPPSKTRKTPNKAHKQSTDDGAYFALEMTHNHPHGCGILLSLSAAPTCAFPWRTSAPLNNTA